MPASIKVLCALAFDYFPGILSPVKTSKPYTDGFPPKVCREDANVSILLPLNEPIGYMAYDNLDTRGVVPNLTLKSERGGSPHGERVFHCFWS